MTVDRLIQLHGLADFRDEIHALLLPAVEVTAFANTDPIPPDGSCFAGPVFLPRSGYWPMVDGRPLYRLAMLKLSEVTRHDALGLLPKTGYLNFWYEVDDSHNDDGEPGFAVTFSSDEREPLVRHTLPGGRDQPELGPGFDPGQQFRHCALEFQRSLTLPMLDPVFDEGPELAKTDAFIDLVGDLCGGPEGKHRVLGWPYWIHNSETPACEAAWIAAQTGRQATPEEISEGAREWLLLFQIDTDPVPGWTWVDAGTIYYLIRRNDLAARRFDRVRCISQWC